MQVENRMKELFHKVYRSPTPIFPISHISGLFGFFCLYSPIFCNFLLYSPIFLRNLLYEIFHYINFCFYGFCGNYILLNFSENNTKKVDHNL